LTVVLNEIYKKYKKEKVEEESVELDDKEMESQGKENYVENYVEGYVEENNEEAQNGNEGNYNPTKIDEKGKSEKKENLKEGEKSDKKNEMVDEEENDKVDLEPLVDELKATQCSRFNSGFLGFKKLIDDKLKEQKDKEEKVIKIHIITGIFGDTKHLNANPSWKNEKYIDQLVRGIKRFVNKDFDKFKILIGLDKYEDNGVKFEFKFSIFTVTSEVDNVIRFKSLEEFNKELDIGIEINGGDLTDNALGDNSGNKSIFKTLKNMNKSSCENNNDEPDSERSDYINLCNITMVSKVENYEYSNVIMTDFIKYKEDNDLKYFFNFTTNKDNSNETVKTASVLNGSCFYYMPDEYYIHNNIDFSECFPYSFKKMLF
ncbi:MAG: hypothetical protein FWC41_03510, partial [Firmicutes bacterium]|nr:hypothetical protein [Bacillota bacterium]